MIPKFWCSNPTKAARRYTRRVAVIMLLYLATVFSVEAHMRAHHTSGFKLYLLAALPAFDIICLLAVVGLYLREEADEFKRQQAIVSVLWATGITLAINAVLDFLRSYAGVTPPPPFTEFTTFWVVMGVAQGVQMLMNRAPADD